MMLFTLGGFFKSIISLFKTRVLNDGGNFEAETNLENQLNTLGSDLFDSASLVITPNGVKTSKLYAIKPTDGTGDLTVIRATTATRVDENGNIVDVPANVARIDYSKGQPAILVEPQRTNLVFPSATATTQTRNVTAVAHTLSFYGTGSITLSGVATDTLAGTGSNNRVSLTFTPTAGNLTLTVSGTVTNWQLEAGSYATSLIKTVSSSVTRNRDIFSISNSSLINSTSGSLFVDINPIISTSINQTFITVNNNSTDKGFWITHDNGILNVRYRNSPTNVGILAVNTSFNITNLQQMKILLSWNGSGITLFANGIKLINNIALNTYYPSLINTIQLQGDGAFFGISRNFINQAIIYQNQLTDSQAIQLTTL